MEEHTPDALNIQTTEPPCKKKHGSLLSRLIKTLASQRRQACLDSTYSKDADREDLEAKK